MINRLRICFHHHPLFWTNSFLIQGTYNNDIGVLVVSAAPGEFEEGIDQTNGQTINHMRLAYATGKLSRNFTIYPFLALKKRKDGENQFLGCKTD